MSLITSPKRKKEKKKKKNRTVKHKKIPKIIYLDFNFNTLRAKPKSSTYHFNTTTSQHTHQQQKLQNYKQTKNTTKKHIKVSKEYLQPK
jgi:hypothetical protein